MSRVLWVAVVVVAIGCNRGSAIPPSAPSTTNEVPPTAPSPQMLVTSRLSGVVRDEQEQPVAGAIVTLSGIGNSAPSASIITDGNGYYTSLTTVDTFYRPAGLVRVKIQKTGYEDTNNYATLPEFHDGTGDFRADAGRRIVRESHRRVQRAPLWPRGRVSVPARERHGFLFGNADPRRRGR